MVHKTKFTVDQTPVISSFTVDHLLPSKFRFNLSDVTKPYSRIDQIPTKGSGFWGLRPETPAWISSAISKTLIFSEFYDK